MTCPSSPILAAMSVWVLLGGAGFSQTFPSTDSEEIAAIVQDPRTFFYDDSVIPPAYQHAGGLHDVRYNISADPNERVGHGFEFPWRSSAGSHPQSKSKTTGIKALLLPPDLPVVYWTEQRNGHPVVRWIFPRNTEVLECLFIQDAGKTWYPYELRRRTRLKDTWGIAVYAPIKTRDDLELHVPGIKLTSQTNIMRDPKHVRKAFHVRQREFILPTIPAATVRKVLSGTFQEITGERFPLTARERFSIVPDRYFGAFAGDDENSCVTCHSDTAVSVRAFDRGRDWYGRIRGDDGILSFHPFAKSSISRNGFTVAARINPQLKSRGMVAKFNPSTHTKENYRQRIK